MKSNTLNRLAVLLTIALFFTFSCTSDKSGSQSDTFVKSIVTKSELKQEMDKSEGRLMLFDLYADWCGPCHVLAPVYNSLASVYKDRAMFYRINVDKSPELATIFGVQSIPLVVFVKNSNAFYSLLGVNSKKEFIKIIDACDSAVSGEECLKSIGLTSNTSL